MGLTPEELENVLDCDHGVIFDSEMAKHCSAETVRELWPRLDGQCRKYSYCGIAYASMAHYVAGDW